jgi:hypothetical protein
MYYGLGAGLRLNLPVSRQRFEADLSATRYQYDNFSQLDYTGYNARGLWDWRAGNDWYGQVGGGFRQARQTISTQVGFFVPNLVRYYDGLANARYALTPRWELQAGTTVYSYRFVDDALRFANFDSYTWDLGAKYTSLQGNSTGVRLRYDHGEWPNRFASTAALFGQKYDQYTLSAVLDWRLTPDSRLHGDVGYTSRQREQAVEGNFSGPSGTLTYDLTLSGKSLLRASVYQTRGPFESTIANYTKQTGIDITPSYQATGKLTFQGIVSYRKIEYLGEALALVDIQRQDKLSIVGVSATYQAMRTVTVTAGVNYQRRTSNVPFGDFKATLAYVSGGVEF